MTRVAIVGGGCAGLGAAATLLSKGVDVVLVEASAILGGRAWTSSDPTDLLVDMGPQFLQDPDSNPWKEIMKSLGIKGIDPAIETKFRIFKDEGWVTQSEVEEVESVSHVINVGYVKATEKLNVPPVATPMEPSPQYQALALGSNGYGSIAESAEPWQYVASDSGRQDPPDGKGNIYVEGGIGNLVTSYANQLKKSYPSKLLVITGALATSIDATEASVSVCCSGFSPIDVDYSIVTVPVSQIETIVFTPPLSDERKTALSYLKLGSYKKVAFRPTAMPDEIEINTEYYVYDEEKQGCWQHFRLPTQPDILICVASGDFARKLDGAGNDVALASARRIMSTAYSNGNFKPRDGKFVVTNWSAQPFIGGAYSYTAYDKDRGPDDPVPLNARLEIAKPHGRVHFAGEATWTAAYGTIAGAYLSGERAAKDIMMEAGICLD